VKTKIDMFDHVVELTEVQRTIQIDGKNFVFKAPSLRELAICAKEFPVIEKAMRQADPDSDDDVPMTIAENREFENVLVALAVALPRILAGDDIDIAAMAAKVDIMNPILRDMAYIAVRDATTKVPDAVSAEGNVTAESVPTMSSVTTRARKPAAKKASAKK